MSINGGPCSGKVTWRTRTDYAPLARCAALTASYRNAVLRADGAWPQGDVTTDAISNRPVGVTHRNTCARPSEVPTVLVGAPHHPQSTHSRLFRDPSMVRAGSTPRALPRAVAPAWLI